MGAFMKNNFFPISYRWFISKNLTNWQPWYFLDTSDSIKKSPDFAANDFAVRAFKNETGADFDVYLFARRQDMDDFAFFVVKDGVVEDRVISIHLSFAGKMELKTPLLDSDVKETFLSWIRETAIRDVENWISEEDM